MELLKEFASEFARNQMDERALLFEHSNYQVGLLLHLLTPEPA